MRSEKRSAPISTNHERSPTGRNIISMNGVTAIIHRQFDLIPPDEIKVLVKEEAKKLGFVPLED
jgi:hypothetical protein